MEPGTLDFAVQRGAARAWGLLPSSIELPRLAPLRARLADEIFELHRPDVEAAQRRFLAAGTEGDPEGAATRFGLPATAAIIHVAEEVVGDFRRELSRRTTAAAAGGSLGARLDARLVELDERLPTERAEYIDRVDFSETRRTWCLRGLDRINRVLGSYVRFVDVLAPLLPASGPATVLDLASGHGGFPLALARLARARGLSLRVIASDIRPEYVEIGRRQAARMGAPEVEFRVVDAFRLRRSFRPGEVDVITCTQSLHHFGAGGIAALVAESLRSARRGIAFVDPGRGLASFFGIAVITTLSTFNPWLLHDGIVSIRRAFVPEEMGLIARCAPGGERLESFWLPPAFVVLRTRVDLGVEGSTG